MQNFVYPVTLTPDKEDGGFVVIFPDLPEAITQGEDVDDALTEAADCLEEAIANRIVTELPIPVPLAGTDMQYTASLSDQMAAKATIYVAMRESGITDAELAGRLNCDKEKIQSLINPQSPADMTYIESVLSVYYSNLQVRPSLI